MPTTEQSERFLEFRGTLRNSRDFTLLTVHESGERGHREHRPGPAHKIEGRLLDTKGRLLVSAPAMLSRTFEDFGCETAAAVLVRVVLPFREGAVKAALAVDGKLVWSTPVAARPPSLSASAAIKSDAVQVSWTVRPRVPVDVIAVDPDSKARRAVALRVTGNSVCVPAAELPGGRLAFSLRASAKLREAVVRTDAITLPVRPPAIEMLPTDARTPAGEPMTVTGALVDAWGRAIADAAFEWALDGEAVGRGPSVTVIPEPGTRQLTARLPNLNVSRTITFEIDEPGLDGLRWQRAFEQARGV